jgi:hypothetical protein
MMLLLLKGFKPWEREGNIYLISLGDKGIDNRARYLSIPEAR